MRHGMTAGATGHWQCGGEVTGLTSRPRVQAIARGVVGKWKSGGCCGAGAGRQVSYRGHVLANARPQSNLEQREMSKERMERQAQRVNMQSDDMIQARKLASMQARTLLNWPSSSSLKSMPSEREPTREVVVEGSVVYKGGRLVIKKPAELGVVVNTSLSPMSEAVYK